MRSVILNPPARRPTAACGRKLGKAKLAWTRPGRRSLLCEPIQICYNTKKPTSVSRRPAYPLLRVEICSGVLDGRLTVRPRVACKHESVKGSAMRNNDLTRTPSRVTNNTKTGTDVDQAGFAIRSLPPRRPNTGDSSQHPSSIRDLALTGSIALRANPTSGCDALSIWLPGTGHDQVASVAEPGRTVRPGPDRAAWLAVADEPGRGTGARSRRPDRRQKLGGAGVAPGHKNMKSCWLGTPGRGAAARRSEVM